MIDIKRFRLDKKINQKEICDVLGIAQPYLSAIEKGIRPLNEEKFKLLYKHYGDDILEYKNIEIIINLNEASDADTARAPMTSSCVIPIYNLDAVAGMHSPNDVVDTSAYIERWIQFPGAHEGDIAFPVSNDSMIPKYLPGALLQVRKVERWQEYFGFGNSFVIFLQDGRRVLKEIQRSEEDPTTKVLCISCNAKYPPEELPKSLIKDVYKVIKSLSDEGF